MNGAVYHYRDKNGLECDAVVHLRDGRYGLIEIKLGGDTLVEEGARTLNKLAGKIDTGKNETAILFDGAHGQWPLCLPEDGRHLCGSCGLLERLSVASFE